MPYEPEYDPQFEVLKDIARLVEARLKDRSRSRIKLSDEGYRDPPVSYIEIEDLRGGAYSPKKQKITHEPGIPTTALVPERIGPIAYWVISQLTKKYPDLFQQTKVIGW